MFFIGSNVMNWPLEALRAIKDGKVVQWLLRKFDRSLLYVGHEICVRESFSCILFVAINDDIYAKIHGRIGIVSFCISYIAKESIWLFILSDVLLEWGCVCGALLQCAFLTILIPFVTNTYELFFLCPGVSAWHPEAMEFYFNMVL